MFRRVSYAALAVCLVAAKKVPAGEALLEKSLLAAGGYPKYQRLETVSFDFVEKFFDPSAPTVHRTGRLLLKFHDDAGLRIREEASSPAGKTLTLLTPAGLRQWKDGAAVADATALENERRRLAREAFWLLCPHAIKEAGCSTNYAGLGYLGGKLSQRLEATGSGNPPVEGTFTVFLDTGSQRVDGLTYVPSAGAKPLTEVFGSHVDKRGLVVPLQRDTYDESFRKIKSFSIISIALNDFVDDALFTAESP